jgi:hypothetical protein
MRCVVYTCQFSGRIMYRLPVLSVHSSNYARRQMLKDASTIYKEVSFSIATSDSTTPRSYVLTENRSKQTEKIMGIAGKLQGESSRF